MKKLLLIPFVIVAIGLTGCAGKSIFQGGPSLTASVQNPAGRRELAAVEASYGVALTGAVAYRRYCYSSTPAPVGCKNRRKVVETMQDYYIKASASIVAARNFVRDNPTVSGVSAIGAARKAVADFQAVVNANKVN